MPNALDARDVRRCRALLAVNDFERYLVADFEVVEHDTLQFVGVEEKVLRLAFARDETESFVQQSLDCSCHSSFSSFLLRLLPASYYKYSTPIIAYPAFSGNSSRKRARFKPFCGEL